MPVQMLCPNLQCRKVLGVPENVRGKVVKCHHCSTLFKVPAAKGTNIAGALNNHLAKDAKKAS